jgi:phage terminase large subunit-like protein
MCGRMGAFEAQKEFRGAPAPSKRDIEDMAPALNAIEALVLDRELQDPDHPISNLCVANAVALSDPAGNRKLAKDRSNGRIDGLVAATMAVRIAAKTPPKKPSVYAQRGLLTVDVTP